MLGRRTGGVGVAVGDGPPGEAPPHPVQVTAVTARIQRRPRGRSMSTFHCFRRRHRRPTSTAPFARARSNTLAGGGAPLRVRRPSERWDTGGTLTDG